MGQQLSRFLVQRVEAGAQGGAQGGENDEQKQEFLPAGSHVAVDFGTYVTKAACYALTEAVIDLKIRTHTEIVSAVNGDTIGSNTFFSGSKSNDTVFAFKNTLNEVRSQEACAALLKAVKVINSPTVCMFTVPNVLGPKDLAELDVCARAAGFLKAAFVSDPLAVVLNKAGHNPQEYKKWPASQTILSVVVGAAFTSISLVDATFPKIQVLKSVGRRTKSLIERLANHLYGVFDVDMQTVDQQMWGRMFMLCTLYVEMLIDGEEAEFAMENQDLRSALGQPSTPNGNIRISRELFASWVEHDMCLPVLEVSPCVLFVRKKNCCADGARARRGELHLYIFWRRSDRR